MPQPRLEQGHVIRRVGRSPAVRLLASVNGSASGRGPNSRSTIYRLHYVISTLQRSTDPVTLSKLASGWGVSTKTIHRDMEYLKMMGIVEGWNSRDHPNHAPGFTIVSNAPCPWCGRKQNGAGELRPAPANQK